MEFRELRYLYLVYIVSKLVMLLFEFKKIDVDKII